MAGQHINIKNARIDRILDALQQAIITSSEAWQQLTDAGVNDLAAEKLIEDTMTDPA